MHAEPFSEDSDEGDASNTECEMKLAAEQSALIDEPRPGSGFATGGVGSGSKVVDGGGGKNEMTNVKN